MTLEEMKSRKKELGYTNVMISEKSGVPLATVQKIFAGVTSAPRRDTILALERVLKPVSYENAAARRTDTVNEAAGAYDVEGGKRSYTLDDYLALPEDQRVELIDGVFYDMASPTSYHQGIAGYIHSVLLDFVRKNKGDCYPFISPLDVQLDGDEKTVVQPDVIVICGKDKYKNGRIFGAPDLVIEVISPSSRRKDMFLKYYKYANAGVREYWIVDPEKQTVIRYDLENMGAPCVFGFNSSVPVLIWNEKCVVDFCEITESLSFLM